MKTYIGLFILVVLLVAASGCTTQQAQPTTTTTTVTATAAAPEVPTVIDTPKPTTVATEVSTTAAPEVTTEAVPVATPWSSATFSPIRKLVVHIKDNKYNPDSLVILPGTMVTWINDDSRVHIVKATGDSAGKFTSAELVSGAQFNYDFGETLGTYEFGDPAYPDMKGAIIVRRGDTLYDSGSKQPSNP